MLPEAPKDGEEADAYEASRPLAGFESASDVAATCSPNHVYNGAWCNNLQAPNAGGFDALRLAVVPNHNQHGPGAAGGHSLQSVGTGGHDAQPQARGHSVSLHGPSSAGGCHPQVLCAEQSNLQGHSAAAGCDAQLQGINPLGAEAPHDDRDEDCGWGDNINADALLEDALGLRWDLNPLGEEMESAS